MVTVLMDVAEGILARAELASQIIVCLQQRDVEPSLQQPMRRRKPGETGAGDDYLWHIDLASHKLPLSGSSISWIERNDAMTTDYRTMLAGIAGIQAAATAAAVATATRFAEFALREGELVTMSLLETLRTPEEVGQSTWENAVTLLYERQAELLRGVAGLPRLSLLVFLGELDRIRGRRAVPGEGRSSADATLHPSTSTRG
jgi:hypothetical protein